MYTTRMSEIQTFRKIIVNFAGKTLEGFEQYLWFDDYFEGRYNKDFIDFIFENESYKKAGHI